MIHIIDLEFQGVKNAIAAFIVETSEGPVIVETGPHSTFPTLKKGIEKAGFTISDIKHVFLSHIHFDHAGAAWAFAELGAKIYLHPIGAPHMQDPSRLVHSAKRIYKDQMDVLWGQLRPINQNHLVVTDHGEKIKVGDTEFIGWHTPGHAVHHIAWQVGNNLFAGDVAGIKIENGLVMAPCPPPDIHIEDWMQSIELINGLNLQSLFLTHFGKVDQVNQHLNDLSTCLTNWAEWMKPYAIQNEDIQTIIPKFQAYIADQLRDFGLSESSIRQYETANPSWMSVAGLMRYWKKIKAV